MKNRWRLLTSRVRGKIVQLEVIPRGDIRRHLTEENAARCWCNPSVEVGKEGAPLYGHRAADGRELIEELGLQ